MNKLALQNAVDELATRAPDRLGYGYADTQMPWRYDPAIELPRRVMHDLLEIVAQAGLRGCVLQIGLGRHGGTHRALRLLAQRVVSVERDAGRVAAFRGCGAHEVERDVLIAGDSGSADVQAAVAATAAGCDLLLLDGGDTYVRMRADFEAYAHMVRPGGVVAVVDASQTHPQDGRTFDVDRFVADLQRDFLSPRGVRCQRLGGAHAIHWFQQTAATAAPGTLPWPADRGAAPGPQLLGEHCGFCLHAFAGRHYALRGEVPVMDPRGLLRNDYAVAIVGDTRAGVAGLAEAFAAVEPRLERARELLRQQQPAGAAAIVEQVRADFPGLREQLLPSLEAAPHGKAMLLLLGTLSLFGEQPQEGAALLRAALAQEMLDKDLLLEVAGACIEVLQDEDAARQLLVAAKAQVRRRKIAVVCHEQLRGNALWHYPQLLRDVRGVIQVGAHVGEEVEAFQLLEIGQQAYLEPQPEAFRQLQQRCRDAGAGDAVLLDCAAGAADGEGDLWLAARSDRASFLRLHPLVRPQGDEVPQRCVRVPVRSLDSLVDAGRLDPQCYNLLFVDTEGTELEVLRGARRLLRHIDVLCVAVFHEAVYDSAPLPQQIQTFLRELGDDGFALRAFEPGPERGRGDAVFRRIKVRR